ncbi:MAG: hypothetical protein PWQ55_2866 [Chloroflexota bacterium]|nr:hypothetical protein [Chloroflexota bacterium]
MAKLAERLPKAPALSLPIAPALSLSKGSIPLGEANVYSQQTKKL